MACHKTCLTRSTVRRFLPRNPRFHHLTSARNFVPNQRTAKHPLCACMGAGAHNRGMGIGKIEKIWDNFIVRDLRTLSLNMRDISVRQAPGGSSTSRTDANCQQHLPLVERRPKPTEHLADCHGPIRDTLSQPGNSALPQCATPGEEVLQPQLRRACRPRPDPAMPRPHVGPAQRPCEVQSPRTRPSPSTRAATSSGT